MSSSGVGSKPELESEALELYHRFSRSLEEGGAAYLVDEYLSSIEALDRLPTSYDSSIACFFAKGRDHSRSVTFLVNTQGTLHNATWSKDRSETTIDRSYLNLAAGNMVSAFLAMRRLSENEGKEPPIDVAFILLSDESNKRGYQGLAASLSKAFVSKDDRIKAGTHLIVVESTGLRVCNVQKGCLTFKLIVEGRLHHPSFSWLGGNSLDAVNRFSESLSDTVKPQHDKYPIEVGKTPPLILSRFLVGYLTMTPMRIKHEQHGTMGGRSCIEVDYYVSTPPEFSFKDFKEKLNEAIVRVTQTTGCKASIEDMLEEEPFREDPHSVIVTATSKALLKLTAFEPVFEWLPFPVSAGELKSSGFARDVLAFGPGDWTLSGGQGEKNSTREALLASEVLAQIPHEIASLEEKHR
nr:peptidase dimerization domain-containing protein [Candidatus Njordarchaeum guaymaensis]